MRCIRLPRGGGHVAKLRAGSGEKSVGEQRIVGDDAGMIGEVGVAGGGSDVRAVGAGFYFVEADVVDVDEMRRGARRRSS